MSRILELKDKPTKFIFTKNPKHTEYYLQYNEEFSITINLKQGLHTDNGLYLSLKTSIDNTIQAIMNNLLAYYADKAYADSTFGSGDYSEENLCDVFSNIKLNLSTNLEALYYNLNLFNTIYKSKDLYSRDVLLVYLYLLTLDYKLSHKELIGICRRNWVEGTNYDTKSLENLRNSREHNYLFGQAVYAFQIAVNTYNFGRVPLDQLPEYIGQEVDYYTVGHPSDMCEKFGISLDYYKVLAEYPLINYFYSTYEYIKESRSKLDISLFQAIDINLIYQYYLTRGMDNTVYTTPEGKIRTRYNDILDEYFANGGKLLQGSSVGSLSLSR